MRALVTNDDGIASAGLIALGRAACRLGLDVVVAAPAHEASGSSASLAATQTAAVTAAGGRGRVRVEDRPLRGLDVPAFAVHAAPALITLVAAHGAFGEPPEIVLSGINRGENVGHAIVHSGTVGAALTGGGSGARAMAVSLALGMDPGPPRWGMAADVVERVLGALVQSPPGTIWNLNVPNRAGEPEIASARLAPFGIVHMTVSRRDGADVHVAISEPPSRTDADTDYALLEAGFATVTSLRSVGETDQPLVLRL